MKKMPQHLYTQIHVHGIVHDSYGAVTPATVSAVAHRRAQRTFTRLPRKTPCGTLDGGGHCQQMRRMLTVGGQSFFFSTSFAGGVGATRRGFMLTR